MEYESLNPDTLSAIEQYLAVDDLILLLLSISSIKCIARIQNEVFLAWKELLKTKVYDPGFFSSKNGPYSMLVDEALDDLEAHGLIQAEKDETGAIFKIDPSGIAKLKTEASLFTIDREEVKCKKEKWDNWTNKEIARYILVNYPEISIKTDLKVVFEIESEIDKLDYNDLINLGNVFYYLSRYYDALACYNKALEIKPEDAITQNSKGLALHNLGNYKGAIDCYNKAIQIKPEYGDAWKNKGLALHNLGNYKGAIDCYNKAIQIKPEYGDAWNVKGITLYEMGEKREALACYDDVLRIEPGLANGWNNKGVVLKELQKYDQARDCYDQALKIDPRYKVAWQNKGDLFYSLEKIDDAIECYENAAIPSKNYVRALTEKGNSLLDSQKYRNAIRYYNRAIEMDHSYIDAWYKKGIALFKMEKNTQAIQHLNKSLEIDPLYTSRLIKESLSQYLKSEDPKDLQSITDLEIQYLQTLKKFMDKVDADRKQLSQKKLREIQERIGLHNLQDKTSSDKLLGLDKQTMTEFHQKMRSVYESNLLKATKLANNNTSAYESILLKATKLANIANKFYADSEALKTSTELTNNKDLSRVDLDMTRRFRNLGSY
jgi:tetratricopeptide (TPR) repeat protein